MTRAVPIVLIFTLIAALFAPPLSGEEPAVDTPAGKDDRGLDTREFRNLLRDKLVSPADLSDFGLWLDADWDKKDAAHDVVVLLHGLHSKSDKGEHLLAPARLDGRPTAVFNYPNDHALDESARLLSRELKLFAKQYPDRRLSLIAHSMGGLVARAAIEDPQLDPGNVRRLVMVATPNHGSRLAGKTYGFDLVEHLFPGEAGISVARLRAMVVDGLDEAVEDLATGSKFLKVLNARGRNPRVQYTLVLGSKGPVRPIELRGLRELIVRGGKKIPLVRDHVDGIGDWLAGLDEVVVGKGDGVVAIERGRLEGVDDTVVMPLDHLSASGPPDDEAVKKLHALIRARLTGGD